MSAFFRKLSWLMRRRSREAELHEEIQFHLEEEARHLETQGLTQKEAERAARRDLGNVALTHEDTRAAWTWTWWDQLVQDVRSAWRAMAANKTFSVTSTLGQAISNF